MNEHQTHPNRKILRIPGYDYAQCGAYFVTLCTAGKQCYLGTIVNHSVELSDIGRTVRACWNWLGEHYKFLFLDESIIMPNHLHALIWLDASDGAVITKTLGGIIGAFKTVSSKRVREMFRERTPSPLWQRGFYERIVRTEDSLFRIRQYIIDNPLKWELDSENPDRPLGASPSVDAFLL